MRKVILDQYEVDDLVRKNRYAITDESLNLPELSFLHDAESEMNLLNTASEQFGFTIDKAETKKILDKLFASTEKDDLSPIPLGGAVLFVEGPFSIDPVFTTMVEGGKAQMRMYVYHKTVTDERHRALAHQLIETAAVEFLSSPDEEYMYQILSNVLDDVVFEEIAEKAKGLPIYEISFADDGSFKLKILDQSA